MGFLKKALSSVGIGSAKVDAILDSTNVTPGCPVTGQVVIKGGNVEQEIDNIFLEVKTYYKKPVEIEAEEKELLQTGTIQKVTIPITQVINPKEEISIPFDFELSPHAPVSIGKTKIWISTSLDVKMAIDPSDMDYIQVKPHPYMDVILVALERLGFRIRETENEYFKHGHAIPFIQEFEFVPTTTFRGELDELEIVFLIHNDHIELLMEIDRKARGLSGLFAEILDMDEINRRLTFTEQKLSEGPDYIAEELQNYISKYV